jgi:hypothetical protein
MFSILIDMSPLGKTEKRKQTFIVKLNSVSWLTLQGAVTLHNILYSIRFQKSVFLSANTCSLSHRRKEKLMLVQANVFAATREQVSATERVQDTQMSKLRFLSKTKVEA